MLYIPMSLVGIWYSRHSFEDLLVVARLEVVLCFCFLSLLLAFVICLHIVTPYYQYAFFHHIP